MSHFLPTSLALQSPQPTPVALQNSFSSPCSSTRFSSQLCSSSSQAYHMLQYNFFIPCFGLFKPILASAISTYIFKGLGNKQIKLFLHIFSPASTPAGERCVSCICYFPGLYMLLVPSEMLHEYKNVKHRSPFLLILGFIKNTFPDYVTLNQKLILPESLSEIFRYEADTAVFFCLFCAIRINFLKSQSY